MEQAAPASTIATGSPAAFRVACRNANGIEDSKGRLLLDALDMEMQGAKVDVIAITECSASVTMGCVGSYRTVNSLQSTRHSGHGGGIALLLHPEYRLLGSCVSTFYIAATL